jgi:NADPH:quinone reductase
LGATVIGTVSSEEKARFAAENGCHYPIIATKENFVQRVNQITDGMGCNVVYDGVGKDTFLASLDCLVPYGLMVCFGQSSGAIPPFDIKILADKGSLFLTRPMLFHYKKSYEEYLQGAAEFFDLVKIGKIKIHVGQTYYLRDAASAHRDLEARQTHGSTLLIPG